MRLEKEDNHIDVYSDTEKGDVGYSIIFDDSNRRITVFYEFSSDIYLPESKIIELMMQKRNVNDFNELLKFLSELKKVSKDPSVTSIYNWLMLNRSKLKNAPVKSSDMFAMWVEYKGKDETFKFEISFGPAIKIIRLYLIMIRSFVFPESIYTELRKSAKEIKNVNDFLNFIDTLAQSKSVS